MLEIILFVLIVAADQITKYLTELYIPYQSSVPLWRNVLELANVHNTGAAWGMFAGGRWIFIVLTLVVCGFIAYYLRKERKRMSKLARYSLVLINFPVFNVADSSVTIGAALLIIDTIKNSENSFFHLLGLNDKKNSGKPDEE